MGWSKLVEHRCPRPLPTVQRLGQRWTCDDCGAVSEVVLHSFPSRTSLNHLNAGAGTGTGAEESTVMWRLLKDGTFKNVWVAAD